MLDKNNQDFHVEHIKDLFNPILMEKIINTIDTYDKYGENTEGSYVNNLFNIFTFYSIYKNKDKDNTYKGVIDVVSIPNIVNLPLNFKKDDKIDDDLYKFFRSFLNDFDSKKFGNIDYIASLRLFTNSNFISSINLLLSNKEIGSFFKQNFLKVLNNYSTNSQFIIRFAEMSNIIVNTKNISTNFKKDY